MIDNQKPDWFVLARRIFEKFGGNDHGDYYQIFCPCEGHTNVNTPACVVTPSRERISVWCHSCERDGEINLAYQALIDSGDIPTPKQSWLHLWEESEISDFGLEYFEARGIKCETLPDSIHVHEELHCTADNAEHLALIALVTDQNGLPAALHRTYLRESADALLDIPEPRMALGPISTNRVVLQPGTSNTLHVGEGLETMLAVMTNLPAECKDDQLWSCLTANNLPKQLLPVNLEKLHIWADLDQSKDGLKFARRLAEKAFSKNIEVYVHLPKHMLPGKKSTDWLDTQEDVVESLASASRYAPTPWEEDQAFIPSSFDISKDGGVVWLKPDNRRNDMHTNAVRISRHPVWVSTRCPALESTKEQFEVRYFDSARNRFASIIIPNSAVSSTKNLRAELIENTTLLIEIDNQKTFCNYLQACLEGTTAVRRVSSHTGWIFDDDLPKHALYSDDVTIVPSSPGAQQLVDGLHAKGDFDVWVKNVLGNVTKCYGASFVFACSLAAPLLSLFDVNSIPVPLMSNSGSGKSVAAHAALSAWGHPKLLEISGSSSLVGTRVALSILRDVPTLVDEIQLQRNESLQSLIYDIGNSGKAFKGTRDGGLREASPVRTTTLFTGEQAISESITYDGANVRVIVLHDEPLREIMDDDDSLNKLRLTYIKNYGLLGPKLIKLIQDGYADETLMERYSKALEVLKTDDEMQVRQTERYAAMLVGIDLLEDLVDSRYCLPLRSAVMHHWSLAVEERAPELISNRSWDVFSDYVLSHLNEFGEDDFGNRNIAGEWQPDGSLAVLRASLKTILSDFDVTNVLRDWKKHNKLFQSAASAKRGFTDRAYVQGRRIACIVLSPEAVKDLLPERLKDGTKTNNRQQRTTTPASLRSGSTQLARVK